MSVQKPGPGGHEGYLQRLIAAVGILLILISQLPVFSKPLSGKTVFPP